jgi:hypothetical protein
MSQSFLGCDRGQAFLLPPSLDEWLPGDHFGRFVIATVEAMDLTAFYAWAPTARVLAMSSTSRSQGSSRVVSSSARSRSRC